MSVPKPIAVLVPSLAALILGLAVLFADQSAPTLWFAKIQDGIWHAWGATHIARPFWAKFAEMAFLLLTSAAAIALVLRTGVLRATLFAICTLIVAFYLGLLGARQGNALDVAGSADEGAVVVVPVVAVFLVVAAVLFGTGALVLVYFGSEALLAVAIEVAFSYASARTAVRLAREGWLGAAVRLTWKPLLGALACALVLGIALDRFMPQVDSLPQAVRVLAGRH